MVVMGLYEGVDVSTVLCTAATWGARAKDNVECF